MRDVSRIAAVRTVEQARGDRIVFLTAIVAAVAVLCVISWPMAQGRLYTLDDLGRYHIPTRAFYADCLKKGLDPSWCPDIYCGYYLHGEGQVGMYHPLHLILYRVLPFTTAFNLDLLLSYPAMLAGMFFFLRRWRFGRGPSMFGALIFAMGGFGMLHFMHMNAVATIAHLPWLLLAEDLAIRGSRSWRILGRVSAALLAGSAILLGYPQYVWFLFLAAVLYLAALRPWWRLSTLWPFAAALAAGGLIGGVQLVPTLDAFMSSTRVGGFGEFDFSVHPANFLQLVCPYMFAGRGMSPDPVAATHEFGVYYGAAAIILFSAAALVLRSKGRNARLFRWSLLVALIGALCMIGRYNAFYRLAAAVTPIGWFRAPGRYGVFLEFAVAIGAAVAMQSLECVREGRMRISLRASLVLAALPIVSALAVALTGWPHPESAGGFAILSDVASTDAAAVAVGPILVAAALALLVIAIRGARWALAAIVLFAAADLGAYGVSFVRTGGTTTLEAIQMQMPGAGELPGVRIFSDKLSGDMAILNGWKLVDGYAGLPPMKRLSYDTVQALRLASCRDVSGTAGFAPLPRARMVCQTVVGLDPAAIDTIDVATMAVVPQDLRLEIGLPGSATITRDLPGDIAVETDAPSRQLLVVSESWHRGWRATIDGTPAAAVPAYGDFTGVAVDKGSHMVQLTFQPDSLRYGKLLSGVGLLLTAVLALGSLLGTRAGIGRGDGFSSPSHRA